MREETIREKMTINSYQASKLDELFETKLSEHGIYRVQYILKALKHLPVCNLQPSTVFANGKTMAELERQAGTIAVTNAA